MSIHRRSPGTSLATSGIRDLHGFLTHPSPTMREAVVGSAYLAGAFVAGFGATAALVAAASLRRRHTR